MFELNSASALDERQTKMIKNHLDMVFIHDIDPSYPEGDKLNKAHYEGIEQPMLMRC